MRISPEIRLQSDIIFSEIPWNLIFIKNKYIIKILLDIIYD